MTDTSHDHGIACRYRQQFRPNLQTIHTTQPPTCQAHLHSTATPTAVQTPSAHTPHSPNPCAPSNHSCPHPHVKSTSQRGRLRGRGGPFACSYTTHSRLHRSWHSCKACSCSLLCSSRALPDVLPILPLTPLSSRASA